MTRVIRLNPDCPDEGVIERAASIINGGGLVAFPTETVYGLGADAMNEQAVRRIFEAKGRPSDNPLIVHVANSETLSLVAARVSAKAERLMSEFWPGPLSLILERKPEVAPSVSPGLDTVAVRMPASKIALALISTARTAIAAPSANRSGGPSATEAAHVASDLAGRIDMILDGGATRVGIESTVVDMTADPPVILRPGWVTRAMLARVIGEVERPASKEALHRSPGTRYHHYRPRARVVLIERGSSRPVEQLCRELLETSRVGLISHTPVEIADRNFVAVRLADSAADYARAIYAAMRAMDERGVRVIVVEGISDQAEGAAVMERLRRAASEIV
jgi:L-threonylcarbamoyladenylate synthase